MTEGMATAKSPSDCECPVCHEELSEPKILPCTHRMCRKCLLSWLETKDRAAGCPLCRVTILPSPSPTSETTRKQEAALSALVDRLPTDLATMALVESKLALSGERLCSVCDEDVPAASFCFDCNIRLCKACAKVHAKLPLSSDHALESLATLTAERLAASRPAPCHTHAKRPAELYCYSHQWLICMLCATSAHRNCSGVISVGDVARQERAMLADQAHKLREREADLETQIRKLEKEVQDAQAHFSTMRCEVKTNCERLQQTVTKRRHELMSAIKEQEDAFLVGRASTRALLEEQKTALGAHATTVEELVGASSDSALLGMLNKIKERLSDLDTHTAYPVEGVKEGVLGSVTFDSELVTCLERAVAACCRVSSKESPGPASSGSKASVSSGDSSSKPVSDGTRWLYVPFNEDITPPVKVPPEEEPRFVCAMSAKTITDSSEPCITCLAVTGTNVMVMTDAANNALKAVSLSKGGGGGGGVGSVVSFTFPPFSPVCVCALEGGKVAMTLFSSGNYRYKGIRLLDITPQPLRAQVQQMFSTQKLYRGICPGPDGGACSTLLAASGSLFDENIRRDATVDIISRKDGKILRSVAPELTVQVFHSPASVCSDSDGFLYVSDVGANKVWKLVDNREMEAPRSTDLTEPRQVVADEEGRAVYVAGERGLLARTHDTKWRVLLEGGRLAELGPLQAVCVARKNLYVAGQKGDGKILRFALK